MPIDLQVLCREIQPSRTVLLFGAGSSIPSGAPSAAELCKAICQMSGVTYDPTLSLADIATLVELKGQRREMVQFIFNMLAPLKPTRGLLNLPLYDWKDIVTTNYDDLVEKSYARSAKPLDVKSSNYDFGEDGTDARLYKMHGTLGKDRSVGQLVSLVLTNEDYENATKYRELVFDRMLHETSKNDVVVIGHSLADPDLNIVLNEAARRKRAAGAGGKLYALIYTPDMNRAALLEQRGFSVCFGGLDDFFLALAAVGPSHQQAYTEHGDLLDVAPQLRPVTIDVGHSISADVPNAVGLFNGGPAQYGDIHSELTFTRDLTATIETQLAGEEKALSYVLGPAGFGKSTMGRQVMLAMAKRGFICWEHKENYRLDGDAWVKVAAECARTQKNAVLFVDDAHIHLRQLDKVIDALAAGNGRQYLRLLLVSAPAHWHSRTKTPNVFRIGVEHTMRRLSYNEINSLLDLFDRKREVSTLVEAAFSGFSRQDKLRRLAERCRADMFVCLKNIFGFESLDDIILTDYAAMDQDLQDIYKVVAAMEASNIRVHRQLVMRILGIRADFIQAIVTRLTGIVTEYTVSEDDGIYAWRGRHPIISGIILKHKYNTQDELFDLYGRVIDFVNPSYEIERMTIDELCDPSEGIGRITDRARQNHLYRKLMSVAPSQRVPRHRLIHNLIYSGDTGDLERAANEIRIFEKDLRRDAPIVRFKALLGVERARTVAGLMTEDRVAILREAITVVETGLARWPADKSLHTVRCNAGLEILKLSGKWDAFDAAIAGLENARDEYLDPEMPKMIGRFKLRAETATSETN